MSLSRKPATVAEARFASSGLRWIAAVAVAALAVVVTIWLGHLAQTRALEAVGHGKAKMAELSREIHDGTLHLLLAGQEGSPWQHRAGLALLSQAAQTLDELDVAEANQPRKLAIVRSLSELKNVLGAGEVATGQGDLRHRIILHRLDDELRELEQAIAAPLEADSERMDLLFDLTVILTALLLAGGCAGLVRNELLRVAATRSRLEIAARHRSTLEALAEGVLMLDARARVVTVNPAAQAMLGRTLDQMPGAVHDAGPWDIRWPDGQPMPIHQWPLARALRSGEPVKGSLISLMVPGRGLRLLSVNAQPLPGPDGRMREAVVSMTDVTDSHEQSVQLAVHRTQLEQLVHTRTAQLEETVRAKLQAESFAQALTDAARAGKDSVVIISADATAAHQSVITVMEAARRAGLTQITFATQTSAQAGAR